MKIRPCGSRVVPRERMDRRTERHDEANSRFSQFFFLRKKSLINFRKLESALECWSRRCLERKWQVCITPQTCTAIGFSVRHSPICDESHTTLIQRWTVNSDCPLFCAGVYVRTVNASVSSAAYLPVGRGLSCDVTVPCCIHDITISFTESSGRGQSYVFEAAYRPGFVPCVLVGRSWACAVTQHQQHDDCQSYRGIQAERRSHVYCRPADNNSWS